jgi:hypothetical protein
MRLSLSYPQQHTVLKENIVFDLQDFDLHTIFQEHNPGIKCNLPVLAHLFATLQTLPVQRCSFIALQHCSFLCGYQHFEEPATVIIWVK